MKDIGQKGMQSTARAEEPYTCTVCGRKNLRFEDIVFKEDAEEEIIPSSVTCEKCGLIAMWPSFKNLIKPGHERDVERLFRKMAEGLVRNHNRRLVRSTQRRK